MPLTLSELTVEFFRNREGQIYRFQQPGGEGHVDLELLRLAEGTVRNWTAGRATPFSLIFRSVGKAILRPGLPTFIHPDLDPFEISLQRIMPPAGLPPDAVYYEACFS